MKICIFGAGAIGGYLGAELALAGADVTLIARGPHLQAMKADGLRLKIGGETKCARVKATDDPAEAGLQDYVVVALKAHSAAQVAESFRPLLGPDTAVVTAQNGIPWWYFYGLPGAHENTRVNAVDPAGKQWDVIGPGRAIGCVVYPACEVSAPGVIEHIEGNRFTLGEPDGSRSDRVAKLAEALIGAGFVAPVKPKIRNEIWVKLWGNCCFNPIAALTHTTLDVIATEPATRALCRAIMEEAKAVSGALGVDTPFPVEKRLDGAAAVGPHKPSMLQDLERGRPMEIDALVSAVQELGRLAGVPTPNLDAVLALVQQRARIAGLY
ncbi:MAG: 2-dehydropantoate 2-reductase [Proteobacteria bacterium]|nr:2-dehydropantoate 2-reductase [Pseudomonadota bacterium]